MSFLDLATLTLHRRTELEARLKVFCEKCDRSTADIAKLKAKAQSFVSELNCDPSELKERFLSCMKQLDEFMYIMTDFNLCLSKFDDICGSECAPVQDTSSNHTLPIPLEPFNLIDALSEPAPSSSSACSNKCPPEKPKKMKTGKADQMLIQFSSGSSSEEHVLNTQNETVREVKSEIVEDMSNIKIEEPPSPFENNNLPAQTLLETDQAYEGTIMHVDGGVFWVITDDLEEVRNFFLEITDYYKAHYKNMSLREVKNLTCCAFYDKESDCYYRGLYLKISEEESHVAEIFAVDTGEIRNVHINCLQPLHVRFCNKPPYARCCHLAGVELLHSNKSMMEKQEAFMNKYAGRPCTIEIDDNTSESVGVYVTTLSNEFLNEIIVQEGLASLIDKPQGVPAGEVFVTEDDFDITQCPEYDDPVVAVTGYLNRDEVDICKHYKGGPDKTCFKGSRCKKKHILKHPDGWTRDRIEVYGKCKSLPLPEPGTWHSVLVTYVCHYDRVFVQLEEENQPQELPPFGVVLPPSTLTDLVKDMNSPATKLSYKPLTISPAPGELVAALYPLDGHWYRARVHSVTRADQNVEIMYIDYGTISWVREDQLRVLEPRHLVLPMQAIRCLLAGVKAKSSESQQWAQAKRALNDAVQNKCFDAHIIAQNYDEVTVELIDKDGYSVAEQLAATGVIELTEFSVNNNSATQKIVVP